MITKEKGYGIREKSIRGWAYSLGAALFLTVMAMLILAAKNPASGGNIAGSFAAVYEKGKAAELPDSLLAAIRSLKEKKFPPLLVALDAGHGGIDSGCLGGRVMEKDVNLQITLLLRDLLQERGFQVVMVRDTDTEISKEERVEFANDARADIYVSIHQNTYEGKDKSVGGIETWYDGKDAGRDCKSLAECIHRKAVDSTGAVKRSLIDNGDLYVLSNTAMPACLIETGFLSNPEERIRLCDAEYQAQLAEGIAEGICDYFKKAGKV